MSVDMSSSPGVAKATPLFFSRVRSEHGVALVMVTFVVALATIVVVNLTYSTYMSARMNASVERSLYGEYLLKSVINLTRLLLQADDTFEDGPQDLWAKFGSGLPLPPELLGLTDPAIRVEVEITAEKMKFPLKAIISSGSATPNIIWRDMAVRLFRDLGFDKDKGEVWPSGRFKGKFFNAEELVANLVDYMDPDDTSYEDKGGNFAKGIEGELPKGTFPNRQVARTGELSSIPGFTPARLRKLEGLVTAYGRNVIDINLAPPQLLRALHKGLDTREIEQIISYRGSKDGPFKNASDKLKEIINDEKIYQEVAPLVDVNSDWFQVIAKVDYGTSSYFIRSILIKGSNKELPKINSVELF